MRRPAIRDLRPLILVGWIVVVLATEAWPSWESGIRDLFAHDVASYQAIAEAAPGLPSAPVVPATPGQPSFPLNVAFAQRFPVHWLVGTVSSLTHLDLEDVYRVASVLCFLAILLVMHRVFVALRLGPGAYALCLGMVAASAYPMRYDLAAPGMLSDGVFVLGFAMVALGFVEHRDLFVVTGVAVAVLGRQTAIPLAVAAAVILLLSRKGTRALLFAALTLAVAIGLFEIESIVARPFSWFPTGGVSGFGTVGALDHPIRILTGNTSSDARAVLGVLVPLGVIAGAWLRGRRPSAALALLAVAVLVQPFVLFEGNNSTRLAALALPGLALVAASQLRDVTLPRRSVWIACAATLAASFHARYSDVGVPGSTAWAALGVAAAVTIAIVVGWPGIHIRSAPAATAAPPLRSPPPSP